MATIRSTSSRVLDGVTGAVDAAVSVMETGVKSVQMLDSYVERHLALQEYQNAARLELGKTQVRDSIKESYAEITIQRARYVSKSASNAEAWAKAEDWWDSISAA